MLCPVALRWSAVAEVLSFLARAFKQTEKPNNKTIKNCSFRSYKFIEVDKYILIKAYHISMRFTHFQVTFQQKMLISSSYMYDESNVHDIQLSSWP